MPTVPLQGSVGAGGRNLPADVVAVKTRLIALGFVWLAPPTPTAGPQTTRTIKLFQAVKNGFDTVLLAKNDGLIQVGQDTHRWLEAANAPRWQRLPLGSPEEGFFNREVADSSDNHDFGTEWLAETIRLTGAAYRKAHLKGHPNAALLTINDASIPEGGNTPDHAGHETGLTFDAFLPRRNGTAGGIAVGAPTYDRTAMREMIKAFLKQPLASHVFLNDNTLIGQGLCRPQAGHHDHAHFEIFPPARVND
ncbi:MAG: hypothetical protein M3416_05450 [Acidobacteriota bacterium]|nr:hypothetical protein [Acidobacteriota bacterium]